MAAATFALTSAACGGQTDSPPTGRLDGSPADTSTPTVDDDAATQPDATAVDAGLLDALSPPEPCATPPVGAWTITHSRGFFECLQSPTSELHIGDDDGGVGIDHEPCDLARGATQCTQEWTFDPAQCAIRGTTKSDGIYFMERQCITRQLTLFFHADRAEGTMTYRKCWCGAFDGTPTLHRATAVKNALAGLGPRQ